MANSRSLVLNVDVCKKQNSNLNNPEFTVDNNLFSSCTKKPTKTENVKINTPE